MTDAGRDDRRHEIIIVRRGSMDDDEGHQGGVWKIAFADFMTAMMCFFLVLWLINAANEEARVALSSYFNPVKLIDRSTSPKGVEELDQTPQEITERDEYHDPASQAPANGKTLVDDDIQPAGPAGTRKYSDQNFFSNPYAVLSEIAADVGRDQNISHKGDGGVQIAGPSSGASGGESYRDPFAPDFWTQQVTTPDIAMDGDPGQAREQPVGATAAESDSDELAAIELAEISQVAATGRSATGDAARLVPVPQVAPLLSQSQEAADEPAEHGSMAAVEEAANDLRERLSQALMGQGLAGAVTVAAGDDGILISVTDDVRNGMFPVGSAVPERALVLAMEKIGEVLADQPGTIRIHGHTDARPFRSGDYDNWRLSTARAHAAQYMLIRGGLDESRIDEVAGFADRRLKMPDSPLSDANRRIEILLEARQ
ncbi:MotB family protein [Chelativorans sp. Marseille-P2723]|uniref:MotB family protein n=1 Tax=Chelativorans sp. Marseille-P2723 TaxID=2709133 RepID=UPI00156EC170|nr:MotB family protein [Chelativorans sp. Marseille-P2723]